MENIQSINKIEKNFRKRKADQKQEVSDDYTKKLRTGSSHFLTKDQIFELLGIITQIQSNSKFGISKELAEKSVYVVVVGDTSSTKSTLTQGITGCEGTLPTKEGACSMTPTKVCIVRENDIPFDYQIEAKKDLLDRILPQESSGWGLKNPFSNSAVTAKRDLKSQKEVREFFSKLFELKDGTPDYKEMTTLKIKDKQALQLVIVDTPGPRAKGSIGCFTDLLMEVEGCTSPIVLMPIRYTPTDILSTQVVGDVYKKLKGKLTGRRIIVPITCIDILLEKKGSEEKLALQLINQIKELKDMFREADLSVVLVQAMDPNNPNGTRAHHREIEEKTLKALPESLKNAEGIFHGTDVLVGLLMNEYVARYNTDTLQKLKKHLETQLSEKEHIKREKSKITVPSDEADKILTKLMNHGKCIKACEADVIRPVFDRAMKELSSNLQYKTITPPAKWTIFGPAAQETAVEDLNTARQIVSNIVQDLKRFSTEIAKSCNTQFGSFLASQVGIYKISCPKLYDSILAKWDEFAIKQEAILVQEFDKWADLSSVLTNQQSNTNGKTTFMYELPAECAFVKDKNDAVAVEIVSQLTPIMSGLLWNYMAFVINYVIKNFPKQLNLELSKLTDQWKGAAEDEIKSIEEAIVPLRSSYEALVRIIDKLNKV